MPSEHFGVHIKFIIVDFIVAMWKFGNFLGPGDPDPCQWEINTY